MADLLRMYIERTFARDKEYVLINDEKSGFSSIIVIKLDLKLVFSMKHGLELLKVSEHDDIADFDAREIYMNFG